VGDLENEEYFLTEFFLHKDDFFRKIFSFFQTLILVNKNFRLKNFFPLKFWQRTIVGLT